MECCTDLTMSSSDESENEINIDISTSEEAKSSEGGSPDDSVIFVDETESSTQERGAVLNIEISSSESGNSDTSEGSSEENVIFVVDSPSPTQENSVKYPDHVQAIDLSSDVESSSAGPSRQNAVCSVCLEDIEKLQLGSIKCGHTFCIRCIRSLLANGNDRCPKCRMQFSAGDVRSVYL